MQYGGHEVVERRRLLRRTAAFGRHLRWPALGALGLTLVATIARLAGPLVVANGIDHGITVGDTAVITRESIIYIVVLMVQYLAQQQSQYAVAYVGERFLLELRSRVFAKLLSLDLPFFSKNRTGVLVSRMTSDIESITEFVNEGAVLALTNVLTVVGVAVVLLAVDVQLGLLTFAVIAVLVLISFLFQRQASVAYTQVRERIGRVLSSLQEGISGVRVVQAFTQQPRQSRQFEDVNEGHFHANMDAAKAISWYFPAVAFLRIVATGVILLVGGRRVISGDLSLGSLVAFLLYLNWFFEPIVNLANVYNLLQASLAALTKLFEVLDAHPTVVERPDAVALPTPVGGDLKLDGVTFGYEPGRPVLTDLTLVVPPGQRLAVVGETGAGKSTIAKLVMRFYDPDRGVVAVDGHDLRTLTATSRADAVALIPQDGYLFDGTLRDNIRYADPTADDQKIHDVCRAMDVQDWIDSLPDGLDTDVGERGSRFSAGERQLVALARAFLSDPSIVVLDEATSNLDPETEAHVDRALRVVLADRTAIVIAHRLNSALRADRVVMIDDGKIVADGHHTDLLASSPQYRHLVDVWERGLV